MRIDDFKYRLIDQPGGWLGSTVKPDWPILTNLRLDPFERTDTPDKSMANYQWFSVQFWRFAFVQEVVGKFAQSFIDFPPLRASASFNLDAVKAQVQAQAAAHHGT